MDAVGHRFIPYSEADQRCVHQTKTEVNFRDADGADYDVNDHESYHAQQGDIQALLAFRRVQARYTHAMGLTHNPFAALLAA